MIYADVDGKPVPLKDCDWIMTEACGCIIAVTIAMHHNGDLTAATAEQAHKEIRPTKRERDRDARTGRSMQLVTHEAFRERTKAGGLAGWYCDAHKPAPKEAAGRGE